MLIHEKIAAQAPAWRGGTKTLAKEYGEVVIDRRDGRAGHRGNARHQSAGHRYFVRRPATGIKFRGMSIPERAEALPNRAGPDAVCGLCYLLLGRSANLARRRRKWKLNGRAAPAVPEYVLRCSAGDAARSRDQPCSQAVLALQNGVPVCQEIRRGHEEGRLLRPALEDSLNLTAKLPVIAAFIYRMKYFGDTRKPKYSPARITAQTLPA